ncbi:MAG: TM0106 family RecB-like putative nuclease [Candidatus Melainabacteria bacterium]|nr:TM0106 family RecB-like putative nuclease [Candidatus Melainabacteria bacterium]
MYRQKGDSRIIFSPSDLCRFLESEFVSFMDRLYLERPEGLIRDQDSGTDRLLQERGIEHEKQFLDRLKARGLTVVEISGSGFEDRFAGTLKAMKEGAAIIYQAALRDDRFQGYADFLILNDKRSGNDGYLYEPWDTKLALHAKPYHLIQLACYADMLSNLQAALPDHIYVVLGNGETRSLRLEDYLYQYRKVRSDFLRFQDHGFDPDSPPGFTGHEEFGHWQTEADNMIARLDHLCQVAGIRRSQIDRLREAGIETMTALATCRSQAPPGMRESTFDNLRQQARLQIESTSSSRPAYEVLSPENGKGLAALPAPSGLDVYFDMEGYPLVEGGLEYLFGATTVNGTGTDFHDWWAHDPVQEKGAFEQFIDWVYDRFRKDPTMHVYHYAAYEKTALRKLMGRYGTRERELDDLLRNEVLVDLLPIVRQSLRVGQPSYSIKYIERLYRPDRSGKEVSTAMDSVVFYKRWLDSGDSQDWQTSSILRDIRDYNKDDCDSTWQLTRFLRELQTSFQIEPTRSAIKKAPEGSGADRRQDARKLAARMLAELPGEKAIAELLGQLVEFHWREAKPVFWARYDRHAMTESELFEDASCLAGLTACGVPRKEKQSFLYQYSYDPDQDTKIDAGDTCFYAHDLGETIQVHSIADGLLTLKRRADRPAPPEHLNLILNDYVDASVLADSIFATASDYFDGHSLPSALFDLLTGSPPRIESWNGGALVHHLESSADLTAQVVDIINRMDRTTLCIQGPPGSGKTYTAARAIVSLISRGKRVGITSNSHRAIARLMDEVADAAFDIDLRAAKVQSNLADFAVESDRVEPVKPDQLNPSEFNLIGGTAWLFSSCQEVVDYLFIDEAGQVSLANVVAMAPATENIILIGDQMQLAQPVRGTHPGRSGLSSLDFLLGDQDVIPDDFGIFLGITRRMSPPVCSFISGAVYQDRLHPHPCTSSRALFRARTGPIARSGPLLEKTGGIVYHPVEHEGNSQDSPEEADAIELILDDLMTLTLRTEQGEAPLRREDILIVAPFNMQVRRLSKRFPGFRIGTVDKFQGQEAPVVIVSMCASSVEDAPRGMEFIFSKNRLNVAISRAQLLSIVVGSPGLARARCRRIEQMELLNLYCRIMQENQIV